MLPNRPMKLPVACGARSLSARRPSGGPQDRVGRVNASTRTSLRLAAEFVVIVVGVLGALGVDEWRTSSENRQLEAEYLGRLSNDLRADSAEQTRLLPALDRKEESIRQVQDWLAEPSSAEADLRELAAAVTVAGLAGSGPIPPLRDTYDELLSTGRLLFLETSLREELAAYYRSVDYTNLRLIGRESGLFATLYGAARRGIDAIGGTERGSTNDASVAPDISLEELRGMAGRLSSVGLEGQLIAEMNRTAFLRGILLPGSSGPRSFLAAFKRAPGRGAA